MLMLDYPYFAMCTLKENSEPKKIHRELNHCEQISNNEERVEEQVYDYENRLKQQYRRVQDQALIAKATSSLRNQLLQRELQRETRPLKEIETEDRRLINMTFVISLSVIITFVIAALMNADQIETVAGQIRSSTIANLSWFYLLASTSFLLFIVYLGFIIINIELFRNLTHEY